MGVIQRDPWALQRGALAAAVHYELLRVPAHVLLYLSVRADLSTGQVGPLKLERILAELRTRKSAYYDALSTLGDLTLVARARAGAPGTLPIYQINRDALLALADASAPPEANASAPAETNPTLPLPRTQRFRPGGPNASAQTEPERPKERPEEHPPAPQGGVAFPTLPPSNRKRDVDAHQDQCQRFAEAYLPDLATQPYNGPGGDTRGAAAVSQAVRAGAKTADDVVAFVDRTWRRAA